MRLDDERRPPSGERLFITLSLCAYAALILFTAAHHEPWRDEADPWLAARDMNLAQLFRWFHYAGTPSLWYLVLMPAAKLGLPYFSMQLIHALIAIAVAALVLVFAPFGRVVRLLLIFSSPLGYEYAIVARNYALIALFMVLIAVWFGRRFKQPIVFGLFLALLSNASVHSLIVAGAIGIAWGVDAVRQRQITPKLLIGAAIACLGAAITVAELYPAPPDRQFSDEPSKGPSFKTADVVLIRTVFPLAPVDTQKLGNLQGVRLAAVWTVFILMRLAAALLIGAVIYSLRRYGLLLLTLAIAIAALMYVFMFKWYAGDRHAGVVWLLLLVCVWIARGGALSRDAEAPASWRLPRFAVPLLFLSLMASCGAAFLFHALDWRYGFSGAKEAADFLAHDLRPSDTVIAYPDPLGAATLPYLPGRKFWYPGREDFGTYMTWDVKFWHALELTTDEAMRRVHSAFPVRRDLVIVSSRPLADPQAQGYSLVFENHRKIFRQPEEHYFVYRATP